MGDMGWGVNFNTTQPTKKGVCLSFNRGLIDFPFAIKKITHRDYSTSVKFQKKICLSEICYKQNSYKLNDDDIFFTEQLLLTRQYSRKNNSVATSVLYNTDFLPQGFCSKSL